MNPTLLALCGCVTLLFAGTLILAVGRQSQRALRSRVVAAGQLDRPVAPQVVASIKLAAQIQRPIKDRILRFLGAGAQLPPEYRPSFVLLVPAAAGAGLVSAKIVGAMSSLPVGILAGAAAAILTVRFLYKRKSNRYTLMLYRQVPDALSLMLRGVRAGLPLAESVRTLAREMMPPTREEFNKVAGESALGLGVDVALRHLYDRTQLQEYAFLAVVVALQGQTGGNLSETLENLADMIRKRVAMTQKARALAADGRVSAIIVGSMPFGVAGFVSIVNPGYMQEFLTNRRGPYLLGLVAFLLMCGILSIRWLIERSTRD
ncbi:MAG: type II secretion system F family protein [Alphaproteobacteria bacterium]|nr:type II secretion system F family protein [Alphaproteobacteria bacterium]